MRGWPPHSRFREKPMAFGWLRKAPQEAAAPTVDPEPVLPTAAADAPADRHSAREVLRLLELELGAIIRELDRAAHALAGGAQDTAATLSTIRRRTDALTGRTSDAQ